MWFLERFSAIPVSFSSTAFLVDEIDNFFVFPRRHSQPFQRYIHALYQAQQHPTLHPQEI